MTVTVKANGLTISHKGSGGYETNSAPDVCLTPPKPVPIPYSIISFSKDIVRGSVTVLADGGNSIDIDGSAHTPCMGDEPGSSGGVTSGTNVHESTWITYSPNIFVEGKSICRQTDKMFMNNRNTISGTGGNWEPTLKTSDKVLEELCRIFCKIDNDGKSNKDARSKEAASKSQRLKDATAARYGKNAAPDFNKTIMHPTKSNIPGDPPRNNWARHLGQLEDKLRKSFFQNASRIVGRKALKKATTLWTRAIPVVGWAMAAYDVYDVATTASDLWKEYKKTGVDKLKELAAKGYNIFEARPDVAISSNGKVDAIYDFKFGNQPWNTGQKQLYEEIAGQGKAIAVDQKTCQCARKGASA
jgi:hypothetical protein